MQGEPFVVLHNILLLCAKVTQTYNQQVAITNHIYGSEVLDPQTQAYGRSG